ncbi:MAG: hypothetical protein EH225_05665 [Calditrichaeota bacterium]|nr:MAG: hypothetical protein EH225_05665 [Calditrichota bacterium]
MNQENKNTSKFPWYGYLGISVFLVSEAGLYSQLWFFEIYMTPLCWSGLILFLDALNFRLAGNSLIMTRRKEFLWMIPWSVALWYFFEFYNLFIRNWHYVGLPDDRLLRYSGYFWSFATIWPGIYEIFEVIKNLGIFRSARVKPLNLTRKILTLSFGTGLVCMFLPFVVPLDIATYLAAPVWIGMIFMLDPLNYSLNRYSIWRDWSNGNLSVLFQLFLTGFIAGILWEFWNYWATAKWIYTVPILGHIKIFEMPVVGYLGFIPFAVEVFVMWETVKYIMGIGKNGHGQ